MHPTTHALLSLTATAIVTLGCAAQHTASTSDAAAHTTARAVTAASTTAAQTTTFDKPGYATFLDEDGRLWIFRDNSNDLQQFTEHGEPAKVVVRPSAGPNRITVKAPDADTIDGYMLSKPGYVTFVDDGRLWILRDGSPELKQFMQHGEPAKVVVRPGGGPNRMTVKSPDADTIDGYMLSKPGYVTFVEDGRLWIFRDGSPDLAQFMQHGEPAKVIIRPGAGPNRMTVKAVDATTIEAYMAAAE